MVAVSAAFAVVTAVTALLGAQPAAAAPMHNIMIVGSSIPQTAHSVYVSTDSEYNCVAVQHGKDKNTSRSVGEGKGIFWVTFKTSDCTGDQVTSGYDTVPSISTTNYWLNVS